MVRLNYQFSNLLGTSYRQGNLVFSADGNMLYSAVGNRVSGFDLVRSRSFTFPFEARRNIARLALSPDGAILLTIDDEGHLLMVDAIEAEERGDKEEAAGLYRAAADKRQVALGKESPWVVECRAKAQQLS